MSCKLLEFGGKANVILRAYSDFSINDYAYKKNEVVLVLKNVDVNFGYRQRQKQARVSSAVLLDSKERKINLLQINNISLTSDFLNLFSEIIEKEEGEEIGYDYLRPVIETVSIENGIFYPISDIVGNVDTTEGILFTGSYDSETKKYTIDSDDESVVEDGEYEIVYYTPQVGTRYNINKTNFIPYLTVEVIGNGNVDKNDANVFISIPRASIVNDPDYSLNDNVFNQDLTFQIIDDDIVLGDY